MNRDEMEGKTKDLKGRAKESAGDLTDNERLEREGRADQVEGKVQETYGKGKRKIDEAVDDLND
jgi:uncharacterized protein YjbJ (UPF0337 family)